MIGVPAVTQIFSLATPSYVLQVSDRLVSTRRPGQPLSEHDPKFNKHILFLAKDAIVAIGMSGVAYIENVPTDQWLASVLTGEQPSAPQGGPGRGTRMQLFGRRLFPSGWLDIGAAMRRMAVRLSETFPRLSRQERESGLYLSVAGWQGRWRWSQDGGELQRLRPILHRVWPNATQTFLVEGRPRYWGWESQQFGLDAVPKLPPDVLANLITELSSPPNNVLTDDVAEGILLTAMRRLSQMPERGVGNDYLSVSLNVHREPIVRIRYHPGSPTSGFYTGWLVTPSVVQPPQNVHVSQGISTTMRAGIISISFEGPPIPSGPGLSLRQANGVIHEAAA
jgi:hypothetical protein